MNEQIQELVGQAKFMAEETTNKKISKNAELDAFAEKFAKMLVELCAKQCNPEPGLKYSPNSLSARIDCKNKILELL